MIRAVAIALLLVAAPAQAQQLSLDDALKLAARDNPRLRAARARAQSADDVSASVSRRRLPALRVSEEWQRYDKAFAIAFPLPGAAPGTPVPAFVAREQTTNTLVLSADQPVLGLGRLSEETAARDEGAAASASDVATLAAAVREAVELGYLRHFEARALQQIAQSSERELGEQLTVARARLQTGVITEADTLRIEVAIANARQQGIAAGAEAERARVSVLAVLGRAPDPRITLQEPSDLLGQARRPAPSLEDSVSRARRQRPELAADEHRAEAARHTARARTWALAPEIDLEAAYLRLNGQVFMPKNSGYVGVKAQWGIWEWGAGWKERQAALAQAEAARLDGEDALRQIESELAAGLSQDQAARAAVSAADTAIAGAEEAFRETNAQVKAGIATTTDLLVAQSALTQARLNLARAQYALATTHVQLQRAIGE